MNLDSHKEISVLPVHLQESFSQENQFHTNAQDFIPASDYDPDQLDIHDDLNADSNVFEDSQLSPSVEEMIPAQRVATTLHEILVGLKLRHSQSHLVQADVPCNPTLKTLESKNDITLLLNDPKVHFLLVSYSEAGNNLVHPRTKESITEKGEMAPFNVTIVFLSSCFLLFLAVTGKESALERSKGEAKAIAHKYQTVKLNSFLSSSICDKKKGSLQVVHKHGPCSKFSKNIVKPLTVEEILSQDQSRVESIRSRFTAITTTGKKDTKTSKATMTAKSGTAFNSGNYVVTVGLGNPKKDVTLIFDTGSDVTWTQCQPCAGSCYSQIEPIFEPSSSTTYSNISCTSTECSALLSATGNLPGCSSSSTCVYGIQYGDGSFSAGYLAKEKLTLTSDDVIDGFMVGCGQNNEGNYGRASGLLGLGKGKLSVVSQAAKRYGKIFSYCLPSTDSPTGYLTIGRSGIASTVKYTPLLTSQGSSSFYMVDLNTITVGGNRIAVGPSSTILDSGTVITRLPPKAYSALSKAFRAQMKQYPLTKPLSILDTCYDLSNHTDVKIPKISMVWGGNVGVEIPASGILLANDPTQVCFPFAKNDVETDPGIYGNVQQMTTQVVYDIAAGKVGFSTGECA
ncbi:hypothetical protein L1887_23714 [Cichorium endivia]|nr:hypothetical protein L1887_23714 [Cichorium endivia]